MGKTMVKIRTALDKSGRDKAVGRFRSKPPEGTRRVTFTVTDSQFCVVQEAIEKANGKTRAESLANICQKFIKKENKK